MKANLTSPRYRHCIDLDTFPADQRLIACGVFRLSPGQWIIIGGNKARFVRVSRGGALWVTYGKNSTANFSKVCKLWLAR
jgi:hypothetical protein